MVATYVLLLVAQVLEFSVYDLALFGPATCAWARTGTVRFRLGLAFAIHDLRQLVRGPRKRVLATLHSLEVIGLERFLRLAQRVLERLSVRFPELRAVLAECALGRVHE